MGEPRLEELERVFKALANINRLKLLVQLQSPRGYSEIDLSPSRGDSAGSEDRSISRQAVRSHIQELMDIGVVVETPSDKQGSQFLVDHSQLFALVEQMRSLAQVQPSVEIDGRTLGLEMNSPPPEATGAHLLLVRGVQEGRCFELDDNDEEGQWVIGRATDSDIPLDYDAYASAEHAKIIRRDDEFFLMDSPANKNGTFLNWEKITRGGIAPLSAGDVLGVGMSLLVFREHD